MAGLITNTPLKGVYLEFDAIRLLLAGSKPPPRRRLQIPWAQRPNEFCNDLQSSVWELRKTSRMPQCF
jgi:hypothetical protein